MPEGIGSAEFIRRSVDPDIQKNIDNSVILHQKKSEEKFNSNDKEDRLDAYFNRLEQIFKDDDPERKQRKINIFKDKFVYPNILIDKDHVPESYFNLQRKMIRERGQGDIYITPEMKKETGQLLYNDQKKSLDNWFNYLNDPQTTYDTWFKFYVLKSVVKLGNYDKAEKKFSKRTKDTTGIFPDLNQEALAHTYDVVKKYHLKGIKEGDEDFKRTLDSANFGKIYSYIIDKVTPASKENKENIRGEWSKFNQGSDNTPLYESLQGHGTGWCTAGEETSKIQLQGGDFYVYYSKDEKGKNTIPRIAIRMEHGQVAEVRGIDPEQNMEVNMIDIAREKYHSLPGGEKFDKKDHDMKLLTLIDNKIKNNQSLTGEEFRFLYEIEGEIEGFGWKKDPRIEEIQSKCIFNPENEKEKILYLNHHVINWLINEYDSSMSVIYEEKYKQAIELITAVGNSDTIEKLVSGIYNFDYIFRYHPEDKNKIWELILSKGNSKTAQIATRGLFNLDSLLDDYENSIKLILDKGNSDTALLTLKELIYRDSYLMSLSPNDKKMQDAMEIICTKGNNEISDFLNYCIEQPYKEDSSGIIIYGVHHIIEDNSEYIDRIYDSTPSYYKNIYDQITNYVLSNGGSNDIKRGVSEKLIDGIIDNYSNEYINKTLNLALNTEDSEVATKLTRFAFDKNISKQDQDKIWGFILKNGDEETAFLMIYNLEDLTVGEDITSEDEAKILDFCLSKGDKRLIKYITSNSIENFSIKNRNKISDFIKSKS